MCTRRKQLTKVSSDEEDSEEVIPQTAPGFAASERVCEAALPAEQREETDVSALPLLERECRARRARLADLLSAAAAAPVAELKLEEPEKGAGV
ncbi:unnamed protein product [Lampetra planeri]